VGYLESRFFRFRGVHKAVLGTTFNRDNLLLSSLVPTNTGERKPEAIPGIAPNVDKDQMFFVSHSSRRPRIAIVFWDFRFRRYTAEALRTPRGKEKA
jgi:hypothetical protein